MAFVFRSELKSCFDSKAEKQEIGPGYYHKEDSESIRKPPNKVPFLASSPRIKNEKIKEVPGPGAYYNENEQFAKLFKNTYNNNLFPPCNGNGNLKLAAGSDDKNPNPNINFDVIYRALENENMLNDAYPINLLIDEQFEKLGFLSKNKRFKELRNFEVPGPGAYLRSTKSKSAKNINKKNYKEQLKKNTLSAVNKRKVETIPAKNHVFGYDYDPEGNLKPNDDPLKELKHMGVKGSSVGPGNYELVKEKEWIKKGSLAWGSKAQNHTQNNFFRRPITNIKKNDNTLNKSFSPEAKTSKFFNNTSSNFHHNNAISNCNNKVRINSFERIDVKNNNESATRKFTKSKKLRNFSSRKYSAAVFRKKFNLDTDDDNNDINNNSYTNNTNLITENQNLYNKESFKAFKKTKQRLSQSFSLEKKESAYIKTNTDIMLKFFKEKNKKRKEILLMNHTNKLFDRGYLLQSRKVDNNPGPGYYLEEKMYTSFKPQPLPEEKQTFGSISQRFPYLNTQDTLGPGAYFREDFNLEKSKQKIHKEKTMIPQFNKLKSYKPVKVEHNVFPGPGEYEPEKTKKRVMTAAPTSNFGSKEPRFKKSSVANEASKVIGPGTYNNPDYWAASSKADCASLATMNKNSSNGFRSFAKILVKPNSANPHRNMNRDNNFEIDAAEQHLGRNNFLNFNNNNLNQDVNNKQNNKNQARMEIKMPEVPGVGAYNADAIYSLEYKIAKNCAKNSLVEAPFNSTKTRPRFQDENKKNHLQSILGPGIYHKIETNKFKQIYPPFKNTEKRFRDAKSQYKTNPGQYDTSSYFDWNKKSFNILYL